MNMFPRRHSQSPAESSGAFGCWGRERAVRGMFFHGKGQLQWLLLPSLDHLLPKLAFVLHAFELRFNVLLRYLEQAQDAVVRLLCDHIQDVAEALRAALAPSFVNAERHVLCALLPSQQLNICLALVKPFGIIEAGAWEDSHDLRELHDAFRQRGGAMLQVFER